MTNQPQRPEREKLVPRVFPVLLTGTSVPSCTAALEDPWNAHETSLLPGEVIESL